MIVPPFGRIPEISSQPSGLRSPSIAPRQPFRTPNVSCPSSQSRRQTARITGFSPGQSPPPVSIPTRMARAILHSLRRADPDKLQAAREDALRRAAEPEAERFRIGVDHPEVVVEAVEVVRDLDRVDRERLRPASRGRLAHDARKLRQALDELALLRLEARS